MYFTRILHTKRGVFPHTLTSERRLFFCQKIFAGFPDMSTYYMVEEPLKEVME